QPQVPRDLEIVCLKCLQKDPRKRYATAAALADDLRRFQGGEPVHARPTPTWERALRWARRRPAAAALVVLATAALLGLSGFVLWHYAELRAAVRKTRDEERVRPDALARYRRLLAGPDEA